MSKVPKVRTSFTMDPAVVLAMKNVVKAPDSGYKSVSAFIEEQIRVRLNQLCVSMDPVAVDEAVV